MKILVFGNGYIGNEYINSKVFVDIKISKADVTRVCEIEQTVEEYKPDVIINTAGKTNLEWCRDHKLETLEKECQKVTEYIKAFE